MRDGGLQKGHGLPLITQQVTYLEVKLKRGAFSPQCPVL